MIAESYVQESFDKTAGYFEHGKTENGNYTDDPSTRVDWRGSQNLDGKTAREDVLLRLEKTREKNSAVKNPVYHVVVSWDSGNPETGREADDPAPEEMEEAAKTLLDDLGLGEHEAWIVAHKDTDTPHLHIMVNRVHPRTKRVWDDGSDYVKQYESLRKLEEEYGWNQTGPETIEEKWAEEREDPLDYWEVAQEKFGREMSFRQVARLTLERELREAKSWPELEEAVEEKGAALEPRNERGMIIRSGEEGVSLYKVARDSSRPRLEARFGQTWERYQEMKEEEYSREAIITDGRRRKDRLEAEISSMLDQRAVGRVDVLNERLMEAATPSGASASEASDSEASASGGNASEANPSRAGTGQLETGSGTGATRPPEERFEAGGGDLSQENTDHVYEGEPTGRRSSTSASGLDGAAQPSAPESMATPTSSSQPRRGRNDSAGTGSPDNGSAENAPSGNDRSGPESGETPLDLRELRTQVKHLDAIERKKSAVVEARARGASSQAEAQERALERLEEANGSGDEIRREVGSAVNAMSIEEKKRFAQMTEKRVHPLIKEAAQFDKAETEREAQEAAQEAQAQQNSETLEYANRVFQESAQSLDEDDPAKEYLRDRTYGQAEEVGVGYAPDSWRDLKISANGQGFSNEDLRNAGLTRKSNSDRPDYDAYSNQLTFPLRDKDNTLRGFTARWNDGAVDTARRPLDAKYINTSDEVVGFEKKKALFRDAAEGVEGNEVVVTEGPLDAMAARSAGEKAVALSGTRLSREHTDILRDVADNPDQTKAVVVLDGDQAGRDGTRDSLEALQREVIEADVVRLSEGQDLDEYIRENGAEEWRRYKAENQQTAGRSCCREGEPASAPHNRNRGSTMAIGAKIKQARKLRSLSQRDLAERLPVSDQTVSKYEREESLPDSTRLMEIADALDVDLSYFLRAPRVGDIEPAYRTERSNSMKVKEKDALIERIREWLERYLEVESILHLDDLSFEWPDGLPWEVASLDDVEDAALALRDAWNIGRDPIENLTDRLEDRALRVGSLEAPDAFDACAFVAAVNGGTPVIVFNEERSGDRQRFTIAHELGHLVLDVQGGLSEEKACHRFSGAFLAPPDMFVQDVGEQRKKISLRELELLKEKYGISMQALIDRMRDLDILNKHYAGRLSDWFEDSGHKKEEPGETVPREYPQRFERMVEHALAEELISKRRAAELLDRDVDRLSDPVLA